MKTKKIVIDKSVFRGTSTSKLQEFVRNHFLILPDVLYYECVTSDEEQDKLLDRFKDVVLAGGFICPSRNEIIQKEAKDLSPYRSLVNLAEILAVKKTFQENSRPFNPKKIKLAYENELKMAQSIKDLADGFIQEYASKQPGLIAEIRKSDNSRAGRPERLVKWAEFVDSQDIHNASKKILKNITRFPEKYCLSDDWVSWHFLRLILILSMESTLFRGKGDTSGIISVEHNLQDITYILLLSRAEGLLTQDNGCSCLAKAAFPEKDIFSDINQVPEEYICNYS